MFISGQAQVLIVGNELFEQIGSYFGRLAQPVNLDELHESSSSNGGVLGVIADSASIEQVRSALSQPEAIIGAYQIYEWTNDKETIFAAFKPAFIDVVLYCTGTGKW